MDMHIHKIGLNGSTQIVGIIFNDLQFNLHNVKWIYLERVIMYLGITWVQKKVWIPNINPTISSTYLVAYMNMLIIFVLPKLVNLIMNCHS
jgi:hypothetical protein